MLPAFLSGEPSGAAAAGGGGCGGCPYQNWMASPGVDGLAALPSSARCAAARSGNMGSSGDDVPAAAALCCWNDPLAGAPMTIPTSLAAFIACPYLTDVATACWRDAAETQSPAVNEEAPDAAAPALKPSERSPPRPALAGDGSQSATALESGADAKRRPEDATLAHSRRAAAEKTRSQDRLAGEQ
jgi:hypothetical protein